jgi:hypothetical protein
LCNAKYCCNGEWENDKRQGKGRFTDVNGSAYEGEWTETQDRLYLNDGCEYGEDKLFTVYREHVNGYFDKSSGKFVENE